MSSMRCSWLCGISRSFLLLSPAQGQVTYVLLTRSPLISKRDSFDLHVLGTPPAFILSQDQTLVKISQIRFNTNPKSSSFQFKKTTSFLIPFTVLRFDIKCLF